MRVRETVVVAYCGQAQHLVFAQDAYDLLSDAALQGGSLAKVGDEGVQLAGDEDSAHHVFLAGPFPALEDNHVESIAGQLQRGCRARWPCTDHDAVVNVLSHVKPPSGRVSGCGRVPARRPH